MKHLLRMMGLKRQDIAWPTSADLSAKSVRAASRPVSKPQEWEMSAQDALRISTVSRYK